MYKIVSGVSFPEALFKVCANFKTFELKSYTILLEGTLISEEPGLGGLLLAGFMSFQQGLARPGPHSKTWMLLMHS